MRSNDIGSFPLESPEEAAAIQRLREGLPELPDFEEVSGDVRLLRFLRGYDGDGASATEAILNMLAVRLRTPVNNFE